MDEDTRERHEWIARENRRAARVKVTPQLTCPTCKRENALTVLEAVKGYQCKDCADREEGVGFW